MSRHVTDKSFTLKVAKNCVVLSRMEEA